jgi:hypothetical protein
MEIPDFIRHNPKSREYQKLMINQFLNEDPLIFSNQENHDEISNFKEYVGQLLKDLILIYKKEQKNINWLAEKYRFFKKTYSVSERWGVYYYFVYELENLGLYQNAWTEWLELQYDEWNDWGRHWTLRDCWDVYKYEVRLNQNLIDGELIFRIAHNRNQLTSFGFRNLDEIKQAVNEILMEEYRDGFFKPFIKENYRTSENPRFFELDYYKQFYNDTIGGDKHWSRFQEGIKAGQKSHQIVKKDGTPTKEIVRFSICEHASSLLRQAENKYRSKIGSKPVGEEWISETELFYKLKEYFNFTQVIHHGKTTWLKKQHIDIWIPQYLIGVEYQGSQHDKPVDFFGGLESFKAAQERDARKKLLFKENNAILIEVRPGYQIQDVINSIKSIIETIELM